MTEVSVGQIGSPSSPILVQLKEYEGRRFVDIRRYYYDRKTDGLKPTKKGIMLNARLLSAIRDMLDRSEIAIEEWLSGTSEGVGAGIEQAMIARQQAADQLARQSRRHHIEHRNWRAPTFFECENSGDETTIAFNKSHPFWDRLGASLRTSNANEEVLRMIAALLVAYYQTKFLFDDTEEITPAAFFQIFEYEWGTILKNYSTTGT